MNFIFGSFPSLIFRNARKIHCKALEKHSLQPVKPSPDLVTLFVIVFCDIYLHSGRNRDLQFVLSAKERKFSSSLRRKKKFLTRLVVVKVYCFSPHSSYDQLSGISGKASFRKLECCIPVSIPIHASYFCKWVLCTFYPGQDNISFITFGENVSGPWAYICTSSCLLSATQITHARVYPTCIC